MDDDAEVLQVFQNAVDGAGCHIGTRRLDGGEEVFGTGMRGTLDQERGHRPTCGGNATPLGPQEVQDVLYGLSLAHRGHPTPRRQPGCRCVGEFIGQSPVRGCSPITGMCHLCVPQRRLRRHRSSRAVASPFEQEIMAFEDVGVGTLVGSEAEYDAPSEQHHQDDVDRTPSNARRSPVTHNSSSGQPRSLSRRQAVGGHGGHLGEVANRCRRLHVNMMDLHASAHRWPACPAASSGPSIPGGRGS